jgi:type VI secretion system VasD/TssJ family lipoprotein
MKTKAILLATAAAAGGLAGCGSPCVAKGDQLVVEVIAAPNVNDTGAGAQHVRFQVWGVSSRTMFESVGAETLSDPAKVAALERQGAGRAFFDESNWIQPGTRRRLVLNVDDDEQYKAVGIAALFTRPTKAMVEVDCGEHAGYVEAKPQHRVVFVLKQQSVEIGDASGAPPGR